MALSSPTMRLNSADLPTFGRPIRATTGMLTRLPRRRRPPSMREHVDEVVRRIDRHGQLLSHGDERLVVEEQAVVVDALGRNQREIEIAAVGERATDVGADEQARRRRRRAEQRVLGDDELEPRAGRAPSCSSSSGISGAIETPVTTPMRRPSRRGSDAKSVAHALPQRRHRADAVLDLREIRRSTRRRAADGRRADTARRSRRPTSVRARRAPGLPSDRPPAAATSHVSASIDLPVYRCENCVSPTGTIATDSTASPNAQRSRNDSSSTSPSLSPGTITIWPWN